MNKIAEKQEEKVILVGCQTKDQTDEEFTYSLEELKALVQTAQGSARLTITQKKPVPDPATYIGKGKVKEVVQLVEEHEIDVVIFNDELTSSQTRNLSSYCDARIIDRTQLILDIFSQRAQSREGKLQVELAQLSYSLPRLSGKGTSLSRLGGGIGTRGPGETQLETDRRHIRRRMDEIKAQLASIVKHRASYRERRKQNRTLQVALVGYTNAGKSTILNRLTEAKKLEEDQLFATLDPTTRKLPLPSGLNVLLTDTVGFIQDLPTTLIAAFRSTLEETKEADLLLHVVDASHPNHFEHEKTVLRLLDELGVAYLPVLTVYNKQDQTGSDFVPSVNMNTITLSAHNKSDLQKLSQEVEHLLKQNMKSYSIVITPDQGKLLARCQSETILVERKWRSDIQAYECRGYVHPALSIAATLLDM